MADTLLTLGGVVFQGFEVPAKINFGTKQTVGIHKMIGGERTVDAMGADPAPIKWEGRFRGPTAVARAQELVAMCEAGAQVYLSYFSFFYPVIITEFDPDLEAFYEIPYKITCERVSLQSSVFDALTGGLDSLVSSDLLTAATMASSASIAALAAVTSVQTNVDNLDGLQGAPKSDLAGLTTTVSAASAALGGMVASNEAAIATTPIMASGGFAPDLAASLLTQVAAATGESQAIDIKAYVDRVGLNIAGVTS